MMLAHMAAALLIGVATQASPPPSVPPPKPAAVPAPAAASAGSTPNTVPLESKPLKSKLDAMHDVEPSTGVLARCAAGIVVAAPSLPTTSEWLSWDAAADRVTLVGKNASGKTAILATLRWRGVALEWSWARFSATSFAQALADADRLLPWMTIQVTLDDGKAVAVMAPPLKVSRVLTEAAPLVLRIAAPAGQVLTFTVEPDAQWTATRAVDGNGTQLAAKQGSIHLSVDASTGRVEVRQDPVGGVAIAALRQTIADRTRELTRAIDAEKPFIEAELQTLRAQLVEAQAVARREHSAWPAIPTIRIHDQTGRVYAVLELQAR